MSIESEMLKILIAVKDRRMKPETAARRLEELNRQLNQTPEQQPDYLKDIRC